MLEQELLKPKVVGSRQVLKGLRKGVIAEVFVAKDIDPELRQKIWEEAQKQQVPIHEVESCKELGIACGIKVASASAGILR